MCVESWGLPKIDSALCNGSFEMILRPKKTYSRSAKNQTDSGSGYQFTEEEDDAEENKENECFGGKSVKRKNQEHDMFDQLLASPLKQEVSLKPLSFWSRKVQDLESQGKRVKPKTKTCDLYELSDPESPESGSESSVHARLNDSSVLDSSLDCTQQALDPGPPKAQSSDIASRTCRLFEDLDGTRLSTPVFELTMCQPGFELGQAGKMSDDTPTSPSFSCTLVGMEDTHLQPPMLSSTVRHTAIPQELDSRRFNSTAIRHSKHLPNTEESILDNIFNVSSIENIDESHFPPPKFNSTTIRLTTIEESKLEPVHAQSVANIDESQFGNPKFNSTMLPIKLSTGNGEVKDSHVVRPAQDLEESFLPPPVFKSTICRPRTRKLSNSVRPTSSIRLTRNQKDTGQLPSRSTVESANQSYTVEERLGNTINNNDVFKVPKLMDKRKTRQTIAWKEGPKSRQTTVMADTSMVMLNAGKGWKRSLSLLRRTQELETTKRIAEEATDMTREVSIVASKLSNLSLVNGTLGGHTMVLLTQEKEHEEFKFPNLVLGTTFHDFVHDLTTHETTLRNVDRTTRGKEHDVSTFRDFVRDLTTHETTLRNVDQITGGTEHEVSTFREFVHDLTVHDKTVLEEDSASVKAKRIVLERCGQTTAVSFEKHFNEATLPKCKKIGEGVYGEVFMYDDSAVIKIIPIEGDQLVNGEPQKKFTEIISEIVIAMELSNLRYNREHRTNGFSEMRRCWCVQGEYPAYLVDLWNEYDAAKGSENDTPTMFGPDQLYVVLELANGGTDLEAFVFSSAAQALSILTQAAYSMAIAERALEFEHRDLHWGNILISPTKQASVTFLLDGIPYEVPTKGVQVAIIDFTLSRMTYDGCCIFNDLSVDPTLFESHGDFQFEVYRLMKKEVNNDWSLFRPKTNIHWLYYVTDKMVSMARYKRTNTKVHQTSIDSLKALLSKIRRFASSQDFVQGAF